MLLKLLNDFAVSRHLLDDLAFKRNTPVRWIIHLNSCGSMIGAGPQETEGERENKGKKYDIPKTMRPTGSGQVADFLVDDIGAIFGLNPKPEKSLNTREEKNLKLKYHDFWRQVGKAYYTTKKPQFKALLFFRKSLAETQTPSFLRLDKTERKSKWMIKSSSNKEVKLGNDLLTFSIDGVILIQDKEVIEYWRNVHTVEMQELEKEAEKGLCLVTGERNVPIARTHTPMVTGLPNPAKGTGAGIVGFESDSFRSYGFEQSYNAPTSIMASKAYLRALQYLSGEGHNDHWLSLGPAWLCFWAAETEAVSGIFAKLWRKPDPLTIRNFMISPWAGLEKTPPDNEKFYAVALSAAGPRIVVKDWRESTLKQASDNFKKWFTDLEIQTSFTGENDESHAPLSMFNLACTTIRPDSNGKYDTDNLKPDLLVNLYCSALTGSSPSITLLNPILECLKSRLVKNEKKDRYNESRFALLKLILNRNRKESDMEIKPKLTADTDDPAYNCGRLLSVFDGLQQRAHEWKLEGPTVAERYYGSASTSPSTAFGILWRLHLHHLKKLRGLGGKHTVVANAIEQRITDICALLGQTEEMKKNRLPPSLPRTLNLQAQGRFALGYYQQKAEDRAAQEAAAAEKAKEEVVN
ncbi:MAG: type I-C CRISPR-associated protein Cas8c/Csd1 [Elusimicrobiota bacterium]